MFKVGDIVKGIDDFYSITNKKMTKGKVLKVDNDRIKIQILEHDVKKMLSEIEKCNIFDYLKDECFELLYDETVVSIGLREVNATIEKQKEAIKGLQIGLEALNKRKKMLEECKKSD